MIDQRLSHPTVELSSRLVLLYVKTSKKNVGSEKFGLEKFDDAVHDPLDLASSAPSGHTAPIKIPATLQMAPLRDNQARLSEKSHNGLVLGGPPDLLPTPTSCSPGCHHRLARARTQDAPQK